MAASVFVSGKVATRLKLHSSKKSRAESASMSSNVPEQIALLEPQRPNAIRRDGGPQLLRGLMLPWCPSENRYWTQMIMAKKGTRFPLLLENYRAMLKMLRSIQFPSTDAKQYIERIKEMSLERRFRFGTEKDLRMELVICPPNRRSIDVHNYSKVVLDALQEAGVYADDSQIKRLTVVEGPIIEDGRIVVSLWEIEHDAQAAFKEAWG